MRGKSGPQQPPSCISTGGGHFASRREIEVGMSDLEHLVADQCSVDIHVAHEYVRQNYNHVPGVGAGP